jgi:hypothetical protein
MLKSPDREKHQALDTDVPLNILQAYLWWRVKTGKGRLSGNTITVQTLRKEFQQITRQITRETGREWSQKELANMREVKSRIGSCRSIH